MAHPRASEKNAIPLAEAMALPGLNPPFPNDSSSGPYRGEQIDLLYAHLPASIAISALLAVILVFVQASVIDPTLLLGWSAALAAVLLIRTVLYLPWKRQNDSASPSDASRRLRRFRMAAIATGIVWGIGGVLLAPSGDIAHKIYVAFVLAGLCAGAATTLAIDPISTRGFLFPVLLPQIGFLSSEGDSISLGMGAMTALFLVFLLSSARQSRRRMEENQHLRLKATENERQLHQMLETSPVATRIADADTFKVIFANASYAQLIESTPEEAIGTVPVQYYAQAQDYFDVQVVLAKGGQVVNKLIEIRAPKGEHWRKWVLASYFSMEYQNRPTVLGWFYDITDRKLKEDRVEHLAYHDPLTGLPNRSLFLDRLQQEIARAAQIKGSVALIFVDLDAFKPVNDRYGHNIGDDLLKTAAERIRNCLNRKTDSVSRIGGDEFVVLLPAIKDEQGAVAVAEHIWLSLSRPFQVEGQNLNISSSLGVALYPDHAQSEEQLIQCADRAMYHAKGEGRDCVRVYRQGMGGEGGGYDGSGARRLAATDA
ncbi:MAG: sensor domain-containing diguanylate cyclase [Alphaproteobacteria bacterium CG_4_10_14_0_2_um_filter_63_37]|nr:MAG: GGDEF domain-containing protein [Proteobacteria bacterium CG1_02_64_396]PJA24672.1 MAG: sensor domain-containing diguanylate cyclase [Alphaproteobacteria bacterium CG_4_10_14_0_2_um_filter_63_37]